MKISELPEIPRVAGLGHRTFDLVVLALFVQRTGRRRQMSISQRQILSLFNRSNQRSISKHLGRAVKLGVLRKSSQSRGTRPDSYVRGPLFRSRTTSTDALIRLGNSLWGKPRGILSIWPYSAVWGFGCFPTGAILILAALRVLEQPVNRSELRNYLGALVSASSFNDSMRVLERLEIVLTDDSELQLSENWDIKIQEFLDSNPACNERQIQGDIRRRLESEENRKRVSKGQLTDSERTQLKELPCVIKGCKRKAYQIEHFPPRRFLTHLDDQTNAFLVWAICKRHNREKAEFIKALPHVYVGTTKYLTDASSDELLWRYRASSNYWLGRFYSAFEVSNQEDAVLAVSMALSTWEALRKELPDARLRRIEASESGPLGYVRPFGGTHLSQISD